MSVRVLVNTDLCEGHGLCVVSAPDVFELGEDEKAIVLKVEMIDEVLMRVDDAILRCPVQAITRTTV